MKRAINKKVQGKENKYLCKKYQKSEETMFIFCFVFLFQIFDNHQKNIPITEKNIAKPRT